jgi:DNA-binding MarR family transcriptional regulator
MPERNTPRTRQRETDGGGALWLNEFIPYKLAVVANRLSQSIGALFEERFGIQIPEWRILMALHAHGPTAPNEVVERTSMDKARVSRAQRRLVELDLVAVSEDPRDRRRQVLFLTRKGASLCRSIIPEARRMEAWFLSVLDARERAALDGTLSRLFARSQELRQLGGHISGQDRGD